MTKIWQTAQRQIDYESKTLVMGILNITPDSFSDGGQFYPAENALRQAEKMIAEGADILDIGGESTRPNSVRVAAEEEIQRVVPVIEKISREFSIPISIDTTKSQVALRAVEAGAEIINDVSGLRFDEKTALVAAQTRAGLILMHLRGSFETMHKLPPVEDILSEVAAGFYESIAKAHSFGVRDAQIALDVGIGFGKTFEQNLELIGKLAKLSEEFAKFPMLVGTSRKSFIGKILDGAPPDERLTGSLASAVVAVLNGAKIVRVHDVKATVETLKVVRALKFNS